MMNKIKNLTIGVVVCFCIISLVSAVPRGPEDCGPGYIFNTKAGPKCIQENCNEVEHAHYSSTMDCVCGSSGSINENPEDPNKECSYPSDHKTCPGCVYACVHLDEQCPGETGETEETCEDYCKNQNIKNSEHAIWASGDYSSGCVCECEKGWVMKFEGCVPCEDICQQSDSRAHYDPNDLYSSDNNCGCSCKGNLLEYKFNECRCVTDAHDPDGDGECECKPGFVPGPYGKMCGPKSTKDRDPCGDGKCEDSETNDANCCTDCGCPPCQYCSNNQCKQATALILTSKSSDVGHGWFGRMRFWPQKKWIAYDFENYGCKVVYRDVSQYENLALYLADERVKALAYFGHGNKFDPSTPNMEGMFASSIRGAVVDELTYKYERQGMSEIDAKTKAYNITRGGWLDYFYNNACYSFDDTSMPDTFVRPGGTYWGNRGTGHAGIPLTEYVKPAGGATS